MTEVGRLLAFRNDLAHEPIRERQRWLAHFGNLPAEERARRRAAAEAQGRGPGKFLQVHTAPKRVLRGEREQLIGERHLRAHLAETRLHDDTTAALALRLSLNFRTVVCCRS